MNLLEKEMEKIQLKLKDNVDKLGRGDFGFFILPELERDVLIPVILGSLTKKYKRGIYLSFESNLDEINSFLNRNGLKEKLYVLAKKGKNKPEKEESVFREEASLTEISMLVQSLTKSGKYDFIMLDSPQSILIKHSLSETVNFLNYLVRHNKMVNLVGMGISPNCETTSILMPKITAECRIHHVSGAYKEETMPREIKLTGGIVERLSLVNFSDLSFVIFGIILISAGILFLLQSLHISLSLSPGVNSTILSNQTLLNWFSGILIVVGLILLISHFVKKRRTKN